MKARLLNALVATSTAVVIAIGGSGQPVRAADTSSPWMNVAVAVAQSLFGGGGGGSDLERAKQEIIAAVNAARQEILDHIDDIANADVRACTEAATIQVAQIDAMDPFSLALFVDGAVNCATLSTAYFDAVQHLPSADNIGKLMGQIYSIAMVGFAKLGLPAIDLLGQLIRGYEAVVVKLKPNCRTTTITEPDIEGRPVQVTVEYTCTAYNGDTATGYEIYYRGRMVVGPLDRAAVEHNATRNTSRAVANDALPRLRALRG
ncbi:hypothetical protein ACN27G_13165 [Plantactinospora sp. WMMB334]|uniref:hypothetical protein n=1 Tax=Plantactinospora sp. WMMB334 TaxID=3404119 RepID=UPI003B9562CE